MMSTLSYSQLVSLAEGAGFSTTTAPIAAAIALAESGGNPGAIGDQGTSYGLWQIHLPAHPNVTAGQAMSPTQAASLAYGISSGGTNWHPWSTFNNGAYRQYLGGTAPEAAQAVANPAKAAAAAPSVSSWGAFWRWAAAFVVVAVVLVATSETQWAPVGYALAVLMAGAVLLTWGGAAWSGLVGALGFNPAAPSQ